MRNTCAHGYCSTTDIILLLYRTRVSVSRAWTQEVRWASDAELPYRRISTATLRAGAALPKGARSTSATLSTDGIALASCTATAGTLGESRSRVKCYGKRALLKWLRCQCLLRCYWSQRPMPRPQWRGVSPDKAGPRPLQHGLAQPLIKRWTLASALRAPTYALETRDVARRAQVRSNPASSLRSKYSTTQYVDNFMPSPYRLRATERIR